MMHFRSRALLAESKGLTLVEVLIVTGLLGIMGMVIAQMMATMNDAQVRAEQIANWNDLKTLVTETIRTDGGCQNTLNGAAIPTAKPANKTSGTILNSLKDSSGNATINGVGGGAPFDGTFPENSKAVSALTNITFQFYSTTPNSQGVAKPAFFRINYDKRFMSGNTISESRDIPVTVVPDASGKVQRCYGAGAAELCSALGGIFDSAKGLCNKIDLNGTGGIRPGDQTVSATCSAATEGTIRYNKVDHVLEFCAGPAPFKWVSPSSGSWCGFSQQTNCGGSGWSPGVPGSNTVVSCLGHDPRVSCPSGYSRHTLMDVQGSGRTNACYYTCVSN